MGRSTYGSEGRNGEAHAALVEAAHAEFREHGFDGTNTNAIARRAHYAPQTFYRHFADKLAIFRTVYERWAVNEKSTLDRALSNEDVTNALISHYERHRVFRRSARRLAVKDASVAYVLARTRTEQLTAIASHSETFAAMPSSEQVAILFTVEKLCDALADGEFAALEVSRNEAHAIIRRRLGSVLAAARTDG